MEYKRGKCCVFTNTDTLTQYKTFTDLKKVYNYIFILCLFTRNMCNILYICCTLLFFLNVWSK